MSDVQKFGALVRAALHCHRIAVQIMSAALTDRVVYANELAPRFTENTIGSFTKTATKLESTSSMNWCILLAVLGHHTPVSELSMTYFHHSTVVRIDSVDNPQSVTALENTVVCWLGTTKWLKKMGFPDESGSGSENVLFSPCESMSTCETVVRNFVEDGIIFDCLKAMTYGKHYKKKSCGVFVVEESNVCATQVVLCLLTVFSVLHHPKSRLSKEKVGYC